MSEQEQPKKKNETRYVVMTAAEKTGPWTPVGEFLAHGQAHAKQLAARAMEVSENDGLWFIAIPASSYVPKKPRVRTTTQISFLD